jgi:geranylgeranyl reductase family protein
LPDWDLIVVGAGPAGSAAAVAALRERPDARVLLLDREPMGRDKVCGDGIAPHALIELERLGIHATDPSEEVGAVRLVAPNGRGESAVVGSPGRVVPRAEFDARMLRAAISAGADFRVERVSTVGQGVVNQHTGSVVIGADGSNSIVRRAIGEPSNRGRALAVAIRGYVPTPPGPPRELVLRWDSRRSGGLCYAWAFPTAHGTTNVGYGMSAAAPDHDRASLVRRLGELLPGYFDRAVGPAGVELKGHTLPLTVRRPRPAVGRVLLVGDAASMISPFTGEGIYSAIVSGALAGRAAVTTADPGAVYAKALRSRFGRQHRQAVALYPLIDFRIVLDTVVRAAQRDRRMFERLLDVGLGDAAFSAADLLRFGRHVEFRRRS